MGKDKSATLSRNKKVESKNVFSHSKEKIIKSKVAQKVNGMNKKRKNEKYCEVDSIKDIKDMIERKKLSELDEKIKLLKTELKSLLSDRKPDKNYENSVDNKNDLLNSECNQTSEKHFESDLKQTLKSHKYPKNAQINDIKSFKPSCSSTPSKFSEWLSKTIDEINLIYPAEKEELHDASNVLSNLNLHTKPKEKLSLATDSNSSDSNGCSLPQEKIEELLYKSLVMKNLNSKIYFSDSEDGSDNIKSTKVSKHQKCKKAKKICRNPSEINLVQKNKRKPRESFQRGRKRKLISLNSSHNDVEIINIDDYSSTNQMTDIKTILPETSTICVDSDITNYDWSEPFDLNLDTGAGLHCDVEVAESSKQKETCFNNQELESDCIELMESFSYDEIGKGQPKRTWECPVCFERSKGQEIVATQCGHVFCKKCLESHFSKLKKSCPSCRCDLTDKPIITLFNF